MKIYWFLLQPAALLVTEPKVPKYYRKKTQNITNYTIQLMKLIESLCKLCN